MPDYRRGTRRAALSLAEKIQAQGEIAPHTRGLSNAPLAIREAGSPGYMPLAD